MCQIHNRAVPVRTVPWVVVSVDGRLKNLLDLADGAILTALGSSAREIGAPWLASPHPPAQLLGQLAFASGHIAGIRYPSAKHPGGVNPVRHHRLVPHRWRRNGIDADAPH